MAPARALDLTTLFEVIPRSPLTAGFSGKFVTCKLCHVCAKPRLDSHKLHVPLL